MSADPSTKSAPPRRVSNILVLAAAAVCAIVCVEASSAVLLAVAATPLVLLLPGVAIVNACDVAGVVLRGERVYWFLISSIGATVLGGLVLNLTGGLDRASWAAYLMGVVTVASLVSWTRRGARRIGARPARLRGRAPRLGARKILLLALALGLVASALELSVVSNARATQEHFVQAWILPEPFYAAGFAGQVKIGLANEEDSRQTFLVRVTVSGKLLHAWRVTLRGSESWTHLLARPHLLTIAVHVSLARDPRRVLGSVDLAAPASYGRERAHPVEQQRVGRLHVDPAGG